MDLIYMNGKMEELGVLLDYELDLAFGSDENNFECRVNERSHCCEAGYYLYIEGTEYGGIIDSIEHDTEKGEVVYSGRTWHGILNSRVIEPPADYDYHGISNQKADKVLSIMIGLCGLDGLFVVPVIDETCIVTGYRVPRYILGYDAMRHVLDHVGRKLSMTFEGGTVSLVSSPKINHSQSEEFDSDLFDFRIKKNYNSVNHLICLGSGELRDRTVEHLYVDHYGQITQERDDFLVEFTAVFDFPNAESGEELIEAGKKRLRELWNQNELSITLDNGANNYDVGDYVGAYDSVTDTTISAEITKKIVTIKNGTVNISYKVGA